MRAPVEPGKETYAPVIQVAPGTPPGGATVEDGGAPAELDLFSRGRVRQYELIRELGRGGMGRVYLARDTRLGRRVAVKFITTTSPSASERFIREARATAICTHENIVVIHEVDAIDGHPYMVLEYVEGISLAELLAAGRVSVARVIDIAREIARALERAHRLGIAHRDLKPENVLLSNSGQLKVVDFGLALSAAPEASVLDTGGLPGSPKLSQDGSLLGTPLYMAPEQFGFGPVDHRCDLYALGMIMFLLLSGRHPLEQPTIENLWQSAVLIETPHRSLGEVVPDLPPALIALVDRCLAKDASARLQSCAEFLQALDRIRPTRRRRALDEDAAPFPGLAAFNPEDADRFFGREREVARIVSLLRERALIVVAGASGAGKSSLVRAGVIPALSNADEGWQTLDLRPGRRPLETLANLLANAELSPEQALVRLEEEPGYFSSVLRARARQTSAKTLIFVDQFEELFTLTSQESVRRAFMQILAGAGDHPSSVLRVVISIRSDFLDRLVGVGPALSEDFMRGILLIGPPDRGGLEDALCAPLEMCDYRFEDERTLQAMLDEIGDARGSLPLLQFAATRLWSLRDVERRVLTHESYEAIGGVAGALAQHANDTVGNLPNTLGALLPVLFRRLVTAERTRAIVSLRELEALGGSPEQIRQLVDLLVDARLLVITKDHDDNAVELVHESLIHRWPALQRWLDENAEDTAFLEQVRTVARQWAERGKPEGLVWRGTAATEAIRWTRRHPLSSVTKNEREFLQAVVALSERIVKRRRLAWGALLVSLAAIAAGSFAALVSIRQAEQTAQTQAVIAREQASNARTAEERAERERQEAEKQLEIVKKRERERDQARQDVAVRDRELGLSRAELEAANTRLINALREAQAEKQRAEDLARRERERADRLEQERQKILPKLD